ncbi:hypothetical protein ACFX13_027735 [Malus domestica]
MSYHVSVLPPQKTHKQTIGILSFEVANVVSKTVHLNKSLTDFKISKFRKMIAGNGGGGDSKESRGEEHKVREHVLAEFAMGLVEFEGNDMGLSFFN